MQGLHLAPGFGQRHLGLGDIHLGANATLEAALRQLQNSLFFGQRAGGVIQQTILQGQVNVGAYHVAFQIKLRRARIGSGSMNFINRPLGIVAILVPQVEAVGQA